jgi:hypothetical protein
MIATRVVGGVGGVGYDEKTRRKMEAEEEGIRKGARELERREKEKEVAGRWVFCFFFFFSFALGWGWVLTCLIVPRSRTRLPSFGRRDTRRRRSRRFVAIKAKSRNSRIGLTAGQSPCPLPPSPILTHSHPSPLPSPSSHTGPQAANPTSKNQAKTA